ncbi:heavy-metal-associated domain-containing protein [Parabacteroides sp. OttesenSCG-928-K15]|nr:heavy-metal-associated domain-containing protein [Parabacteroides sp. OttesenSCG-928-K15]
MKFKTNAKCGGCVAAIRTKLNEVVPEEKWSIDLNSPEKTLTVEGDYAPEAVIEAVKAAGFKAEVI